MMFENREFEELYQRSKIENYLNGKYEKKIYTNEEINNKRKHFEILIPCNELEFSKERWLYEIKREFELNKNFKEFPDASFAKLERFAKFGL